MTALSRELRWWMLDLRDQWRKATRRYVLLGVMLFLGLWIDPLRIIGFVVTLVLVALAARRRFGKGRSLQWHERARWERETGLRYIRLWDELMLRLGISIRTQAGFYEVPRVTQYVWHANTLVLNMAMPLGLERSQPTRASSALAESLGVVNVTVGPAESGAVVRLQFVDPLMATLEVGEPLDPVDLRSVPMGIVSTGEVWTFRLGPHTLVAGASGSGKASMIWSLLAGIASAIRSGKVEVLGIDLKGGMELTMGKALLTSYATTPESAVALLEDAVTRMQARALELAGKVREHSPTTESPHVLVLIDELAALTAYQTDRELLRRANNALALLCSQGRAPGFTVFACLQDPRKETLPVRGLFTQTIGLRLRDAMETSMVLGEGMRDKGALCHQIPTTLPGVAFVLPDDGSDPIRVRAGFATDSTVKEIASRFGAPRQIPVTVPPIADPPPTRTRTSRRARTEEKNDD